MSFFSKLFNLGKQGPRNESIKETTRSENQFNTQSKIGQPMFTNAPAHWPLIYPNFLNSNAQFTNNYDDKKGGFVFKKRMFMVNSLSLIGKINEGLSQRINKKITQSYTDALINSGEAYATSICIEKVFEKGIIRTNGIVIDNSKRYAVLLFESPLSINYIHKLKVLYVEDGYEDLIYYSLNDPNTIDTETEIEYETLNEQCFTLNKEKQNEAIKNYNGYGIWWISKNEPSFIDSEFYLDLKEYLSTCSDCNSYILGKLGFALGLYDNDTRILLPNYDELLINGPEGVEIIVTISKHTGINFHFQIFPKYENYRNNFMKNFLKLCKELKAQIIQNNFDRDIEIVYPLWLNELENNTKTGNTIEKLSLIKSDFLAVNMN